MSELSEMNELAEKMEHAAHGKEHGHGRLGMYVGVTIATLGVMLAICSAMVSGQRTELIATMVEQASTNAKYQALSTKYRVLIAQLVQLHALSPDADKYKQWDDESRQLSSQITSADVARLARIIRLENAKNLNAEIPTQADLKHFSVVIKELSKENVAAKEWTESYDAAIGAHAHAAEHYDQAQLAAEIGIVLASIALLFMNRFAWIGAMGLGLVAVIITGSTLVETSSRLGTANAKVEDAKKHFESFNGEAAEKSADEKLLKEVDENQPPSTEP